jgi:AcrR family transcriptional regulator
MEDDDSGLPASIAVAWGVRARPGKGPKRGLSLARIMEAAIKVAVSEGLAAVSMNRVATELGAATMSLYRYVATKDELLTLMMDAAAGSPPAAPPDADWREGLARWAWAYLAVLRRHPWIVRVPISGPPATPNHIAWLEEGLRSLGDTSLTEREKIAVILLLSGFVRNEATLAADLQTAHLATGTTEEETLSAYGRLLARLANPARFPALHAVIAEGVFDAPDDPDEHFHFGLERVLDGIDALIRAPRAGVRAGRELVAHQEHGDPVT